MLNKQNSKAPNGIFLFEDIKELKHLYNSTIDIHKIKNIEIQKNLEKIKQKATSEPNSLEYLEIYFSNLVDLLFSFNSFLINSISFFNEISNSHQEIMEELENFKIFNIDSNNNNSLEKLTNSYGKIINFKHINVDPLLIKRIRVYEILFRHSYAHGNLGNLINFLVFGDSSSLTYICFNEDNDKTARFRILINQETYNRFISSKDINSIILKKQKEQEKKSNLKLAQNAFIYDIKKIKENHEGNIKYVDYIYMTEDISRTYLKWYGHNIFRKLDFSMLFDQKFKEDFSYDVKNFRIGVHLRNCDDLPTPSHYLNYESILNDIENFCNLVIEFASYILIENKIQYLFQNNKVLTLSEIREFLFNYGLCWSESKIEDFIFNNMKQLKKEILNIIIEKTNNKQIIYYKL